jgi:hypothetical protein
MRYAPLPGNDRRADIETDAARVEVTQTRTPGDVTVTVIRCGHRDRRPLQGPAWSVEVGQPSWCFNNMKKQTDQKARRRLWAAPCPSGRDNNG